MSVPPPGANGTITRIGLDGYAPSAAAAGSAAGAVKARQIPQIARLLVVVIDSSSRLNATFGKP
jgi:hypothetical protein